VAAYETSNQRNGGISMIAINISVIMKWRRSGVASENTISGGSNNQRQSVVIISRSAKNENEKISESVAQQ